MAMTFETPLVIHEKWNKRRQCGNKLWTLLTELLNETGIVMVAFEPCLHISADSCQKPFLIRGFEVNLLTRAQHDISSSRPPLFFANDDDPLLGSTTPEVTVEEEGRLSIGVPRHNERR